MGSFKLKRLELPKSFVNTLENQNIYSCKDALSLTALEIQYLLGISHNEALNVISMISRKCVSEPETVYEIHHTQRMHNRETFIATSLHDLDLILQGGLLLGNITEITGPPGVGKTQFCLMLSLLTALPVDVGGLNGHVIYIDTESTFSASRLKQMAQKKFPYIFKSEETIQQLLQGMSVYAATSVSALRDILLKIEQDVIKKNVKLVVVDSIASLFRKEYGAQSVMERNNILLEQASFLKEIAETYKIVVFLTNQITSHSIECDSLVAESFPRDISDDDNDDDTTTTGLLESHTSKKLKLNDGTIDHVVPALGNTWSHCVNTRLMAQFLNSEVRQLIIAKSPVAPNAAVKYILNETGVVLIGQDVEYLKSFSSEHLNIITKCNFFSN